MIATDKISYNPNDQVALISTITNTSGNASLNNVTARITVNAAEADLFETRTINAIMPGAASLHTSYWNAGTIAPGSYLPRSKVWNEAGAVLLQHERCRDQCGDRSNRLCQGQVLVDSQSCSAVSRSMCLQHDKYGKYRSCERRHNRIGRGCGCADHPGHDIAFDAPVMNVTEQHTWQINTQGYTAKDYLVILRASSTAT